MKNISFKAFTLIEVLVSLWIITVAILGPLTVAMSSSSTSRDAKNSVVSAYLAQEAFELMRFSRDTIFLRCINNDPSCVPILLPVGTDQEHNHETAWRMFKEVIANGSSTKSCFTVQNADGCTYDMEGFLAAPTSNPVIFSAADPDCQSLYVDDRHQNGLASSTSATDAMYLCDSHGGDLSRTSFKRVIKVTSIPSVNDPYDSMYNDDLRVEVEVSYSKINLFTKKIKTVDFIRARL